MDNAYKVLIVKKYGKKPNNNQNRDKTNMVRMAILTKPRTMTPIPYLVLCSYYKENIIIIRNLDTNLYYAIIK